MSRNRMSEIEITQREHEEADLAKRVKIVGTQINIATSEEEDSMAVRPVLFQGNLTPNLPIDVRKVRCGRVYTKLSAQTTAVVGIEISPDDTGDFYVEIDSITVDGAAGACFVSKHLDLCARRLRIVVKSGTVSGSYKLIGQG